jgi:hypothetical protein
LRIPAQQFSFFSGTFAGGASLFLPALFYLSARA